MMAYRLMAYHPGHQICVCMSNPFLFFPKPKVKGIDYYKRITVLSTLHTPQSTFEGYSHKIVFTCLQFSQKITKQQAGALQKSCRLLLNLVLNNMFTLLLLSVCFSSKFTKVKPQLIYTLYNSSGPKPTPASISLSSSVRSFGVRESTCRCRFATVFTHCFALASGRRCIQRYRA